MEITNLTYTRRKPVEQYGYEELTATAICTTETSAKDAVELRQFVNDVVFDRKLTSPKQMELAPVEGPQEEKAPAKEEKKAKPASAKAKKTEEPAKLEEPQEEPEEKAPAKEEKKAPAKKSANVAYNRDLEIHKKKFSDYLNKAHPGWKTKAQVAKEISIELNGTDFLDAKGEILVSFAEKIDEAMA